MGRFRHISWTRYGELVSDLAGLILARRRRFDLVIGIARGGVPVALVLADQLDVKVDIINVKSYTGIAERSAPVILSTLTEDLRGRRLLLVDDLVDEGQTMESVLLYLRGMGPRSISTAVLFTKPWSGFRPDFSLEVVEEWVVFPWERGEAGRLRARSSVPRGRRGRLRGSPGGRRLSSP